MIKHYRFGGSTATRTVNCPAWVNLSKQIPKSNTCSDAAATGTMLHEVSEQCVNDAELDPASLVGQEIEGVVLTAEHVADKLYPALDVLADLEEEFDVLFDTEITMELSDDIGGTADLMAHNTEDNIFIMADWKFGDGVIVSAQDSQQLLFYTMLAMKSEQYDIGEKTRFFGIIIQPTNRRDEVEDRWEFTYDDLMVFIKKFDASYAISSKKNAPCSSGSWCGWCPAEPVCPQKTGKAQMALRLPKGSTDLKVLNQSMAIVDEVESWCKAVKKLAHEQAEQGVEIENFKLVAKRAIRKWNDVETVTTKLKNMKKLTIPDYMEQKLTTPPKLEKICKQKSVDFTKFDEYISSISSGTTLVPASDKRSAIVSVHAMKNMSALLN